MYNNTMLNLCKLKEIHNLRSVWPNEASGEYFTPADISELLTRLATVGKTEVNKVYEMYLQGNDTKLADVA